MEAEDLVSDYPMLYHMAEAGSWPSIARHGLMSTAALLDRSGLGRRERHAIESRIRPENVTIGCGPMGNVVIRDQKPLTERTLKKLLTGGTTVTQYCRLLNARTFFWADEKRLMTLLNAKAYRARPHDVLTVDTRGLVDGHRDEITLSRINSGATSRGVGRRGSGTFRRIGDYKYRPTRAYGGNRVAEVAVDYMVRDIRRYVLRVEKRLGSRTLETAWDGGEKARASVQAGAQLGAHGAGRRRQEARPRA